MLNDKRSLRGQVSAIALLASVSILTPAQAQSQSPDSNSAASSDDEQRGLGDIVVTASRRQTTTLSTPINISAIGGDDLAKKGVSNFQDLGREIAGLVYNSASIRDGGASSFIIPASTLTG